MRGVWGWRRGLHPALPPWHSAEVAPRGSARPGRCPAAGFSRGLTGEAAPTSHRGETPRRHGTCCGITAARMAEAGSLCSLGARRALTRGGLEGEAVGAGVSDSRASQTSEESCPSARCCSSSHQHLAEQLPGGLPAASPSCVLAEV